MKCIKIFDTTLRDGEQTPRVNLNAKEKLRIAKQLEALGVDIIEAGFAAASPGDFEAIELIAQNIKNSTVTSLARAVKSDIEMAAKAIKKANKARIHTFIATSPIHREFKLKMSKEEILKTVDEMVRYARTFTNDIEFSAEDAMRTEKEYLVEVYETAIKAGATTINIPDTVGYRTPQEMYDTVKYLKENNLIDKHNILELFDKLDLETLAEKLLTIDEDNVVNFAIEYVCEELLITSSYKIERTGMKLGLHRMEHILELFDHPEKDLKVIHVAGTNGKGSTSSYIKDVLKTKYRVGFYSSPGMLSFNDRIRVNDEFISYKEAYRLFKLVQETYDKNNPDPNDKLSFFEIITGVALLFFRDQKTDFVIMEVGLGGRYDGTNIFKNKELSIITKIGLDHTAILGDSLEKIAYEKGGIIQENDHVLMYPAKDSVVNVIKDICEEKHATLNILDASDIEIKEVNARGNVFSFKNGTYSTKMVGEHQVYNASLALSALFNLRERGIIDIDNSIIKEALAESVWVGRLEWIRENILLDGAHNNDGIDSLVAYLNKQQFSKLTILLGILEDKDYKDMIGKLKTVSAKFSATKVPIEIKESNLDNLIASFGDTHVTKYENYEAALANIIPNLENDEIFLITGSLYLISAVRKEILEKY